jgi:serpin B
VERKTKGKIKGAIEPGQLTRDTRLVLCNAIYFKGQWQQPFKTKDTRPADFNVSTNHTVTVPMMSQDALFKMTCNDDKTVQMLELPYVGTDLSMIILLPSTAPDLERIARREAEARGDEAPLPGTKPGTEPISLADLERALTAEKFRDWLKKLDQSGRRDTRVELPRFTTTQHLDLAKALASLGMSTAFQTNADFSGMDGTGDLYLSSVIHQALVEVNETGTEAAAFTGVNTALAGIPEPFIADHPFLFLIREQGSGAILFLGRMVDPSKWGGG